MLGTKYRFVPSADFVLQTSDPHSVQQIRGYGPNPYIAPNRYAWLVDLVCVQWSQQQCDGPGSLGSEKLEVLSQQMKSDLHRRRETNAKYRTMMVSILTHSLLISNVHGTRM